MSIFIERVEPLQSIKVEHCKLFSILRSVTLEIWCQTTFHKVRIGKVKVVRKIAQKCEEHNYEKSLAIQKLQSGPLYTI